MCSGTPKVPWLTVHEAVEKAVGFAPVSIHGDHCQHLRALGSRSSRLQARVVVAPPPPTDSALSPGGVLASPATPRPPLPLPSGELTGPLALQGLSPQTAYYLASFPTWPAQPSSPSPLFSPFGGVTGEVGGWWEGPAHGVQDQLLLGPRGAQLDKPC